MSKPIFETSEPYFAPAGQLERDLTWSGYYDDVLTTPGLDEGTWLLATLPPAVLTQHLRASRRFVRDIRDDVVVEEVVAAAEKCDELVTAVFQESEDALNPAEVDSIWSLLRIQVRDPGQDPSAKALDEVFGYTQPADTRAADVCTVEEAHLAARQLESQLKALNDKARIEQGIAARVRSRQKELGRNNDIVTRTAVGLGVITSAVGYSMHETTKTYEDWASEAKQGFTVQSSFEAEPAMVTGVFIMGLALCAAALTSRLSRGGLVHRKAQKERDMSRTYP